MTKATLVFTNSLHGFLLGCMMFRPLLKTIHARVLSQWRCATVGGRWHAGRCVVADVVEGKAEEDWHVLVGTASSKATQRNSQRSRQSDKTGGLRGSPLEYMLCLFTSPSYQKLGFTTYWKSMLSGLRMLVCQKKTSSS